MTQDVFNYLLENHLVIVAILVSIGMVVYQIKKTRNFKSISFSVKSKTKLFTLHDENVGKLQILLNGHPVSDAHIFIIEIRNTGNVPIASSDYEKPIEIVFSEGAEILSSAVIEKTPDDLNVNFEMVRNSVLLKPTLLNLGDAVTFKFLMRDDSSDPIVNGRIIGVNRITKTDFISNADSRASKIFIIVHVILLVVTAILMLALEITGALDRVG
ncbi:MAG: hypothetical protein ING08_01880, partial [Roseomonas sp.]|nr:hypothetical protein [Roseomonas sp.]